jgi:hypothetical protein
MALIAFMNTTGSRDRLIGLLGVIRIVQPDADELGHVCYRRSEARVAAHLRQAVHLHAAQLGQPLGRHRGGVDVLHHAGQVANRALRIQNPRLLFSCFPVTYQLHLLSPAMKFRLKCVKE